MADNETYDYQGEDESVNDYQTSGGSLNDIPPPQGGSSMGSRLIIILVFMIIAYAIGYFLTNMSGSTNTAPVQEVPSPIVPQQQPQPAPPPPVQTKEFKLEDSVVFKNFQKQSQQQVDQLKSLNTQLVQQVKQMNDQVLAVQESVANESKKQVEMTTQMVNELRNELYDIRGRVAVIEDKLKPKPVEVHKNLKTFYLRGIIEGRAWINTPKGESMTIRVGDSIPDYGKVTGIFPDQGFVMTTSKRMIVFSRNDT